MAEPLPVKTLRVHEFIWSKFGQLAHDEHLSRAALLAEFVAERWEARLRRCEQQLAELEQEV